ERRRREPAMSSVARYKRRTRRHVPLWRCDRSLCSLRMTTFNQASAVVWIGGGPLSSEPGSAGGTHDGRRGGSLFDELGCFLRARHVRNMARLHFDRRGPCALRHPTL